MKKPVKRASAHIDFGAEVKVCLDLSDKMERKLAEIEKTLDALEIMMELGEEERSDGE